MHHQSSVCSFIYLVIVGALSVTSQGTGGSASDGGNRDQVELKAIANGCLNHRESFPAITCKFTYLQGTANGLDVAIRGQPGDIKPSTTSSMRWLVDKQSALLELRADPSIWKEAQSQAEKAGAPISVPVASQTILTSGSFTLNYYGDWESANISGLDHPTHRKIRLTPFSIGLMGDNEALNPGNMLSECVRGKMTCESIATENLDGHRIVVVQASFGRPEKPMRMKYWLDPDRGFLPIRSIIIGSQGKELERGYWTDIRKCSGGRWFPWRGVHITTFGVVDPDKGSGPLRVEEIRVNSLDVDKSPARTSFQVVLPKGITAVDPEVQGAVTDRLTEDETVGLDDLAKLHKRCLDMAEIRQARRAQWEKEKGTAVQWPFGIITALMATIIGVLGIVRWRYVARRRPS